ncbi:two-component sensor histidine kinase [Thalassomonas viridans]|uniref:histidine kinase n=1 Tax=Thalassomonas viridans TaxID=137584 RepID=A0AAF0C7F8_9GAMM|nr:ATP-binding protein [Thalassomonas viridans]WDE03301.1 two-component sensor histidine kinase [Thalassomonas viridans]
MNQKSQAKRIANKSIKSLVISFLVISITLMTVAMGVVTAIGVNQQSRELMLDNAFQITEGLAKQAVFSILSGSNQNAHDAMKQVQGFHSVLASSLLLEDQSVFLTMGSYPDHFNMTQDNVHETSVIIETNDYWLIRTPVEVIAEQGTDEESEFELDTVSLEEQVIGYAEVIYSKENLSHAQNRVAMLITIVGSISVVLLSLVLHTGLQRLFKPLGQLAQTMQQAKKTGEHLMAQVYGAKEIRNMASSYNSMMEVLDRQEDDLKEHRDQLEKEVEVRTRELVQARDSALTASRHKSEFMANMSHELRTPIQSIIGYGELVTEELELEGNFDLIEDMDKIAKNSQRLLVMINSLLDLAKIEAGRVEINNIEVTVEELKANLTDTIVPLAQRNNNEFTIKQLSNIKLLYLDKEKLEQTLLNLLSNACKFTENGQVTLTIYNDNQQIYFDILDTGIGLTKEQQKYIFDEFRQVDASQSRKFSGTGLGLAISKRFIEMMQGRITVVSELERGARFTVALPLQRLLSHG